MGHAPLQHLRVVPASHGQSAAVHLLAAGRYQKRLLAQGGRRAAPGGFRAAYALPGCLGAIDGSLAPFKKPTEAQANQDADSHHLSNGGIVPLLLAVCDADLQFNCVNAGA
jgi:hypothetical protein